MMRRSKIRRSRRSKVVAGVLFAAIIASGSYALTAANTVPASKAGDGAGTVTGYTVSDIHYNLNATDPSKADSVQFNVDTAPPTGSTVKVQVKSGGTWHSCTNILVAVTCTFTVAEAVADISSLRVVAAQ